MKIITSTDLEPNVKQYLLSVEEASLFYNDYGLKHPAAIYNTSLHKVESDLQDFLTAYQSLSVHNFRPEEQKQNSDKLGEILKRYRSFLYSLREHLDDCFHVVKTLVPPTAGFREDRNQYNWLKNNPTGFPVKEFLQRAGSYKTFLDAIVNELKHNNGVLNWISFLDPAAQDFLLGYYVANVRNNRCEPVEKIHAKFNGEDTAFSFGRDIRFNAYQVFRISEELVALIRDLGITTLQSVTAIEPVARRKSLYETLCELPKHVFPDEQTKDIIDTEIVEDRLVLEYPAEIVLPVRRHRVVVSSFSGDGGYFALNRPVVSQHSGRAFRSIPATHFGAFRPL